jgi:hypothetical protein
MSSGIGDAGAGAGFASSTGFVNAGAATGIVASVSTTGINLNAMRFLSQAGSPVFLSGNRDKLDLTRRIRVKTTEWQREHEINTLMAYIPRKAKPFNMTYLSYMQPTAALAFGGLEGVFNNSYGMPYASYPVKVELKDIDFDLVLRQPRGYYEATWQKEVRDNNNVILHPGQYKLTKMYSGGQKPAAITVVVSNRPVDAFCAPFVDHSANENYTNRMLSGINQLVQNSSSRPDTQRGAQQSVAFQYGEVDVAKFQENNFFTYLEQHPDVYAAYEMNIPDDMLDETGALLTLEHFSTKHAQRKYRYSGGFPMLNMFVSVFFTYQNNRQRVECGNVVEAMKSRAQAEGMASTEMALGSDESPLQGTIPCDPFSTDNPVSTRALEDICDFKEGSIGSGNDFQGSLILNFDWKKKTTDLSAEEYARWLGATNLALIE